MDKNNLTSSSLISGFGKASLRVLSITDHVLVFSVIPSPAPAFLDSHDTQKSSEPRNQGRINSVKKRIERVKWPRDTLFVSQEKGGTMNTSNSTFLLHEAFKSTDHLIVNKAFLKKFGLSLAVQLSYYIDQSLRFYKKCPGNGGWFFCTHKEIVEVLGIKEYSVRKNKNTLKEMEILQTKTRGLPAKEWMKINTDTLLEFTGPAIPFPEFHTRT